MSFANLKRNRTTIDQLKNAAADAGGGTNKKSWQDERVWKPFIDKMGNGYAVIRFLPPMGEEALPWVRYWDHGFKGPTGKWYIERSLTSLGQEDPVGQLNSKLWNMSDDDRSETRKQARDQKRRLHYVSNVMVMSDPSNPENEGKVFMYQYGKKIFDKVMDAMQPTYQDEKPCNPFDMWEGADFKIKIRKVEGWINYDKSEFDSPSPFLNGDDTKLEGVYNSMHSLDEFTDPQFYKGFAELERKMHDVLGTEASTPIREEMVSTPPTPVREEFASSIVEAAAAPVAEAEEEDTMSYFAKLAAS
tara:strand:+ start:1902 stop:2810 length:909 start_codon:yes stop_codon:yes gene_type:complete